MNDIRNFRGYQYAYRRYAQPPKSVARGTKWPIQLLVQEAGSLEESVAFVTHVANWVDGLAH